MKKCVTNGYCRVRLPYDNHCWQNRQPYPPGKMSQAATREGAANFLAMLQLLRRSRGSPSPGHRRGNQTNRNFVSAQGANSSVNDWPVGPASLFSAYPIPRAMPWAERTARPSARRLAAQKFRPHPPARAPLAACTALCSAFRHANVRQAVRTERCQRICRGRKGHEADCRRRRAGRALRPLLRGMRRVSPRTLSWLP